MTDTVSTLDLAPGDVVTRAGHRGGSPIRITEVREPTHPAMPGLVVVGFPYMSGLLHWSPREIKVNDRDGSERWRKLDPSEIPTADVVDSGPGWSLTRADRFTVTVSQHMVSADTIDPAHGPRYVYRFPLTTQRADALARRHLPDARLASSQQWGISASTHERRIYRVRCNHHDGPHRDDTGRRCEAWAVTTRTSGDYRVPVCNDHTTGSGLWRLDRLFYGFDDDGTEA